MMPPRRGDGKACPDVPLDQQVDFDLLDRHLVGDQPVIRALADRETAQKRRKVHVFRAPYGDWLGRADALVREQQLAVGIEGCEAIGSGLDGGDEALLGLLQRLGALLHLHLQIDGLLLRLLSGLPLLGDVANEGDAKPAPPR